MTPREQQVMRLLSSGAPTCAKDLRRESGLSVNALQRVLMRLVQSGDIAEVASFGEVRYVSCVAAHRPKAHDLQSVWRKAA